jgi:hypothetical protein
LPDQLSLKYGNCRRSVSILINNILSNTCQHKLKLSFESENIL